MLMKILLKFISNLMNRQKTINKLRAESSHYCSMYLNIRARFDDLRKKYEDDQFTFADQAHQTRKFKQEIARIEVAKSVAEDKAFSLTLRTQELEREIARIQKKSRYWNYFERKPVDLNQVQGEILSFGSIARLSA